MNATVNIICYKSKTLSNGEHPLMIRVCKDGKKKFKSLGISVNPEYWDSQKNRPKANCPNKDLILKIILEKEFEFQKQILELMAEDKEYTASTLITPRTKYKTKTVEEFYKELVKEFESENRIGNSRIYNDSLSSLKRFTGDKMDIPFSHIDIDFLKGYEKFLRQRNCTETSISMFFRTLRSAYNKAIEAKCAKKSNYPFDEFKVSKFNIKTAKRAISKDSIKQIIDVDLSNGTEYQQLARDLFVFSYFCGGINFTDMANLQESNIVENRLIYYRQKTGKKINLPLSDEARTIILKYISHDMTNEYIFPILHQEVHKTEIQKYNRRKKVLLKVNRALKEISHILRININLTTYVARHSYATVLKNSGVNIALIGETLGHSDIKTTQIYLDSFENSQIDEAMKNLL